MLYIMKKNTRVKSKFKLFTLIHKAAKYITDTLFLLTFKELHNQNKSVVFDEVFPLPWGRF